MTENTLRKFSFRINEGSVFFGAQNAEVKKAVFRANGFDLSIIYPKYEAGGITKLDFFGTEPFHGKLAEKWEVYVDLYVENGTPSLVIIPTDTLTWEACNPGRYMLDVSVGSAQGIVRKTMVYEPTRGGFIKK